MIQDYDVISCKGLPLFEKARIKAPFSYSTQLEERACFFYVLDGSYETIDPFGTVVLDSKEALIKRCGQHISKYIKTPEKGQCEAVVIYFYPEIIKEAYKNEIPDFLTDSKKALPPIRFSSSDLIDSFISNLMIYFEEKNLMDDELAIIKLKEIILLLLKTEQQPSVLRFFSDIFFPSKLKFTSIIENNLYSRVTIDQLAFLCGMSVSSFKREFNKQYQESPAKYLKRRKLAHAAKLLTTSSDRISDIAYDCGFEDVTTFSNVFRLEFNISPSDYRKSQNTNSLN